MSCKLGIIASIEVDHIFLFSLILRINISWRIWIRLLTAQSIFSVCFFSWLIRFCRDRNLTLTFLLSICRIYVLLKLLDILQVLIVEEVFVFELIVVVLRWSVLINVQLFHFLLCFFLFSLLSYLRKYLILYFLLSLPLFLSFFLFLFPLLLFLGLPLFIFLPLLELSEHIVIVKKCMWEFIFEILCPQKLWNSLFNDRHFKNFINSRSSSRIFSEHCSYEIL